MRLVVRWTFRLAAWALVAFVAARIVLQPTQVALTGHLYQLHIQGEREHATAALFRQLGLDAHFPAPRYTLFSATVPAAGLPAWLGLRAEREAEYPHGDAFLHLSDDGTCVLPPLPHPAVSKYQRSTLPHTLRIPEATGRTLLAAAFIIRDAAAGQSEYRVWLHARDRWVNVLRFTSPGLSPYPHLRCRPDGVLEFGDPVLEFFVWDAGEQRFLPPDLPTPAIEVLPLLSEQ